MGQRSSRKKSKEPANASKESSSADRQHTTGRLGRLPAYSQIDESLYMSRALASADHHYTSLGQTSRRFQIDENVLDSESQTSDGNRYASLVIPEHIYDSPTTPANQDLSNHSGQVYTVTIVPTELSNALEFDSSRTYKLQLKDQRICLSEENVLHTLNVWSLNFIRKFHVDYARKYFAFESGRRAISGPGMIKCHFHEDLSDLLQAISKITGIEFVSEKRQVYTVTIVPTELSNALEFDSSRTYKLQLKDQRICLSEENVLHTLNVWPLNFIRKFHVDYARKYFAFESGRRAISGPGMIKCHFHEDLSDLLQAISKITGIEFVSEKNNSCRYRPCLLASQWDVNEV